jgi:alpha-galactosidase
MPPVLMFFLMQRHFIAGLTLGPQPRAVNARREREPRPVHYNCWEAVYFRHELDELKEIATIAAGLGAERFVLDDGWFKGRNDDTSTSLGDWTVDATKYPDGLSAAGRPCNRSGPAFRHLVRTRDGQQ